MQKIKFSIGLVFYSGEKFLLECIATLLIQTDKRYEILFRDNSPHQTGKKFLEKNFSSEITSGKIKIFTGKNLWHSGGHNFLFSKSSGDWYVCGSIDMRYKKNFLEILYLYCEEQGDEKIITGTILDWTGEKIDSAGLEKNIFGQVKDRWQSAVAKAIADKGKKEKIFGASGALFAIEKNFAHEVLGGKIFNEKLHYKNDSFLFYDLVYKGYKSFYIPEIFAYHHRKIGKNSKKSIFEIQSSYEGQKEIFTQKILRYGNFLEKICGGIFVGLQWLRLFFSRLI